VVVNDLQKTALTLLLGSLIGLISWIGRKRNIGEARFDSKTGKQIEDE
jgi:hypothetical protein